MYSAGLSYVDFSCNIIYHTDQSITVHAIQHLQINKNWQILLITACTIICYLHNDGSGMKTITVFTHWTIFILYYDSYKIMLHSKTNRHLQKNLPRDNYLSTCTHARTRAHHFNDMIFSDEAGLAGCSILIFPCHLFTLGTGLVSSCLPWYHPPSLGQPYNLFHQPSTLYNVSLSQHHPHIQSINQSTM